MGKACGLEGGGNLEREGVREIPRGSSLDEGKERSFYERINNPYQSQLC